MKMILRFLLLTLISINCFTYAETANDSSCQKIFNHFSKDDQYVYYDGDRLIFSDPISFQVIPESNYAKDNSSVYFQSIRIAGADPNTFELINNEMFHPLAKDKNRVYLGGKVIESADPKHFQYIKEYFAKDDRSVFYQGFKIKQADPKSFLVYGNGYGRDNLRFYTISFVMHSNAPYIEDYLFTDLSIENPDQLELIDGRYYKDHQNFYFFRVNDFTTLNIPNHHNFYYISNRYFHDGSKIYFNKEFDTELTPTDADLKTFKKLASNLFQDKNGCFSGLGERIKCNAIKPINGEAQWAIDPWLYDNTSYAKDINANCSQRKSLNNKNKGHTISKKHFYYQDTIIEHADPSTFEYVGSIGLYIGAHHFFRDKNHVYLNGNILKNVDAQSFVLLSDFRAKDKNRIYTWQELGELQEE